MAKAKNTIKNITNKIIATINAVIITALTIMPFLQNVSYAEPAGSEANAGRSLGEYRVTYYTYEDNDDGAGHFGTTATASGNPATPHHTAAIDIVAHTNGTDAHGIKMGDRVRIGDEIYTVEDYGSGPDKSTFKEGVDEFIDIFVDPSDGTELPPDYAEVFLLDGTEGSSTESTDSTKELNLLSLIEIAGDENTGYYYQFKEGTDDIIYKIMDENYDRYRNTGMTVNGIKAMMKAALTTQLPDLGGAPYSDPQIDIYNLFNFFWLPGDEETEETEETEEEANQEENSNISQGATTTLSTLDGVLMVGDSITEGMQGYHSNDNVNCIFRGVGGWTSQKWLDNFSRLTGISDVKGINIMLGENDGLLDPDESLKDLTELIEKLHAEYPDVHIFVDKCLPMNGGGQANWTKYNNGIQNLGLSYVTAIDVSANVEYDQDNIHPTANGSKTLFQNITQQIAGTVSGGVTSNLPDLSATVSDVDRFLTERRANRYYDENTFNGGVDLRKVSANKNPGEAIDVSASAPLNTVEKERPEGKGTAEEVPEAIQKLIRTARKDESISFDNLQYLRIPYRNFDDDIEIGTMIVDKEYAEEILNIFYELYLIKYPIQNMQEVEKYYLSDIEITTRGGYERVNTQIAEINMDGGSGHGAQITGTEDIDKVAFLDNDTFCYLYDGSEQSHKDGTAIDLNPYINPKIVSGEAESITEDMFVSRNKEDIVGDKYEDMQKEALLSAESEAVKIFESHGWKWFGNETDPNYMHFEKIEQKNPEEPVYISAKIKDMLYVPRTTYERLVRDNDPRALEVFTMDQNNRPKVASWTYTNTGNGQGTYSINSGSSVNIKKALSKYTMPYELLMAIGIRTEDGDFAKALADIAIDCQYVVAMEESITNTNVTTNTYTYLSTTSASGEVRSSPAQLTGSRTTITETATIKPEVTYVNSWYVKYSKEENFVEIPPGNVKVIRGSYSSNTMGPMRTANTVAIDDSTTQTTTTEVTTTTSKYNIDTGSYEIEGNAQKFLDLYNDTENYKAKRNLYIPWLTNMIQDYETTEKFIDVMKYLRYQGDEDTNYGLSYLKFSDYLPGDFNSTSSTNFGDDYGDWNGGTHEEFIQAVLPYALMIRDKYGIYPSVCIAQAIQESGWGTSNLALNQHNFFGMIGGGSPNEYWSGESANGFKTYSCLKNSVFDYGRNLATNTAYPETVRTAYKQNLGPKAQLDALGPTYCPDPPGYADTVYGLIETYNLTKYDTMSLSEIQPKNSSSGGKQQVLELARTKIGCSYVRGASGPDTFDCTGLCYWAYQQIGITLPRSTSDYYNNYRGTAHEITWDEAQPGDILIIRAEDGKGSIGWSGGHAALYTGGDGLIEAVESGVREVSEGAHSRFVHVFRFD